MGFKQLLPALLVVLMGFISQQVMADAMSNAFSQGSSMGNSAINGMFSNINTTTAQANISHYDTSNSSTTTTLSSYYGNGDGNIEIPGNEQIVTCANSTSSGPATQTSEACDATNFLVKNPQIRPQYALSPSDPLFLHYQQISKNAASIAAQNGVATNQGVQSQCTSVVQAIPAQYDTQSCDITTSVVTQTCNITQVYQTNCAGTLTAPASISQVQTTYPATQTTAQTPAQPVSVQNCTNWCQTTNSITSLTPLAILVCSSPDPTANMIIGYYESYLGRCADQSGLSYWAGSVESGGATLAQVQSDLQTSPEASVWQSQGSPPDRIESSLCGVNEFIYPNECATTTTSTSFGPASQCSTSTYPSQGVSSSPNPTENTIIGYYESYLGRSADNTGLTYWVSNYTSGMPLSTIQSLIQNSSEAQTWQADGRPEIRSMNILCNAGDTYDNYNNQCQTTSCGCQNGTTVPECTTSTSYQCAGGQALLGSMCDYTVNTCNPGDTLNGSTCSHTSYQATCQGLATGISGASLVSSNPVTYPSPANLTCTGSNQIENQLIGTYQHCLGRCPESSGLQYWENNITVNTTTLAQATSSICSSPEATLWNSIGKPPTRIDPGLCPTNMYFISPNQCQLITNTYSTNSPTSTCSSSVNYYPTHGTSCVPGTAASQIIGSIASTTCAGSASATSNCVPESAPQCTPGSTVVNGIPVSDACMTSTTTNICTGTSTSDTCQTLINQGCSQQSSTCTDTLGGQCVLQSEVYRCMTQPPSQQTVSDCSNTTFCQGGSCFNTSHPNDTAFATATAMMEAGREGGVYNQNGVLFSGVDESCRIRLFGAKNCCATSSGAGYSNNAVMGVAMQVGGQTLEGGSKYMYDALYTDNPGWLQSGLKSLMGAPTLSAFSPSVSMYGFTVTYTGFAADGVGADGAAIANGTGAVINTGVGGTFSTATFSGGIADTTTTYSVGAVTDTGSSVITDATTQTILNSGAADATGSAASGASSGLLSSISDAWNSSDISGSFMGNADMPYMFNPYMLAAMVVIMIYEDETSCNTAEQMLDMKRGQNLCTYVGTYCSDSINLLVGSVCMEHTQSYCCYNSLLAKIIEEQGRVQIGKGYGSVQSPDCSGLTTAQFSQIDFSKIDLSAFTAQIMASINMNNVPGANTTGINNNANNVVQQKIQNYYNNGSQ
jgi:hypothetical protein